MTAPPDIAALTIWRRNARNWLEVNGDISPFASASLVLTLLAALESANAELDAWKRYKEGEPACFNCGAPCGHAAERDSLRAQLALAHEEIEHFSSDRDEWKKRTEEWQRVAEYSNVAALKAQLATAEASAAAMREGFKEALGYVPDYFKRKHDIAASLDVNAGTALIAERDRLKERLIDLVESFDRDDGTHEHEFEIDNALERAKEFLAPVKP